MGRRPANRTIPQYIDLAAISRAPIQNHKAVTTLSADMGAERNAAARGADHAHGRARAHWQGGIGVRIQWKPK